MAEYALAPLEEPPWSLDADEFAQSLRKRWPDARVGVRDLEGSPMVLHALIPLSPPRRELGIALGSSGKFVTLDPAEPDTAAEFAYWYVRQVPKGGTPVHLISTESSNSIELTTEMSETDIMDKLSGTL